MTSASFPDKNLDLFLQKSYFRPWMIISCVLKLLMGFLSIILLLRIIIRLMYAKAQDILELNVSLAA